MRNYQNFCFRSKFYDVQDKIHELETSINDVCLTNEFTSNREPNSFLGNKYLEIYILYILYICIYYNYNYMGRCPQACSS